MPKLTQQPLPLVPVRTTLAEFVTYWSGCTLCDLARTRTTAVLGRGTVPCDVLFIGEGPGESEDTLGLPFVGPAGRVFDSILSRAVPAGMPYAVTNVVACIPPRDDQGHREPPLESVKACQPRLAEFILLCRPRLIVAVGSVARDWLDPKYRGGLKLPPELGTVKMIDVMHPAATFQMPLAQREFAIQRAVVQISNAVEEL